MIRRAACAWAVGLVSGWTALIAGETPRVVQRGAQVIGESQSGRPVAIDLRDLARVPAWRPGDPIREVPRRRGKPAVTPPAVESGADPLVEIQRAAELGGGGATFELLNFAGQGFTGVNPPDTVGDVGPGYFIQSINGASGAQVVVYDKADGSVVAGPFALESLGAGSCASGLGDPIVLWDEAAGRWLLSEFSSSGNRLCVYVSRSDDPVADGWCGFEFAAPEFPDYPKYGVWHDAWVVTTNESASAIYALDRDGMVASDLDSCGVAKPIQRFTVPNAGGFGFDALTPADIDGATLPPGTGGIVMRHFDDEAHNPVDPPDGDELQLWSVEIDWTTPANSQLVALPDIAMAPFDSTLCGLTSFYCMGMPGVAQGSTASLDPLREVVMNRLAYRNFGSHESLVGNFVVDVGSDRGGVRWFELRRSGGNWTLHQQGTYSPDTTNRWMAAIAQDQQGNLLLGYNASDPTSVYPSLRFTGRFAGDAAGTMTIAEQTIAAGDTVNGSNRYGDYSSMSVDPENGCTFWFTGEWNDASNWSTRIAAIELDGCAQPDFSLSVTPPKQFLCPKVEAEVAVEIGSISGFDELVTLGVEGVPDGVGPIFEPGSLVPPGASTLFLLDPVGIGPAVAELTISGTATGSPGHSDTVELVIGAPVEVALESPPASESGIGLRPVFSWAGSPTAASYLIEVDDDPGFASPEFSLETASSSAQPLEPLAGATRYYWRLVAENDCGTTASATRWFVTRGEESESYCVSPALAIPDNNPTGLNSPLVIASGGTVGDLDVALTGTHTWVGDLKFSLTNGETTVSLIDRPGVPDSTYGCSSNDFDLVLDDEGASPVETLCAVSPPALGGTATPQSPLAAFTGAPLADTWTLNVSDHVGSDTGSLAEWCLIASGSMPFADGFESGGSARWSDTVPEP